MLSKAYAAGAYAAFTAVSIWGVLFLADLGPLTTVDSHPSGTTGTAVLIDVGLWLVFALQHSLMARPRVKAWLPARSERSTYVLAGSLALALVFWQWRALPHSLWHVPEPWAALLWTVYGAGWVITVAATHMTDHWQFFGLKPASYQGLSEKLLYAWIRHPMMTGMLLAFWFTPAMTVGHLLYAVLGTAYIAVGVHYEERDLRRRLGVAYDEYADRVPRFVPQLTRTPQYR